LLQASSKEGFLASLKIFQIIKGWARDGVICGLAALASGDEKLIETLWLHTRNTSKKSAS
jgi:hypothetical protein